MPLAAIVCWLLTAGPVWGLAAAANPSIAAVPGSAGGPRREGGFAIEIADAPTGAVVACPTRRQVMEALGARMRNILDAGATRPDATVLSLTLAQVNAETMRLELRDHQGALVLERLLEAAARQSAGARPRDAACIALADTVGLIVERYLRQIGYRDPAPPSASPPSVLSAPPSPPATPVAPLRSAAQLPPPAAVSPAGAPPPARRTHLGVRANLAAPVRGLDGDSGWIGDIALVGDFPVGPWALSASAGVGQSTHTAPIPLTDGGTLRVIAMPLRLGFGRHLPLGRGAAVPGIGAGVDVLWTSTSRVEGGHPRAVIEPVVEAGGGTWWPLGAHAYARIQAAAVFSVRPHDFVLQGGREGEGDGATPVVFRTPRLYLRGGVELGVSF